MVKNTCVGNGTENSLAKSISSLPMKPSIQLVYQRGDRWLKKFHLFGRERGRGSCGTLRLWGINLQGNERPVVFEDA